MGKMTDKAIAVLYENGKKVYNGELDFNDAVNIANKECPEVAISSARHYINWYSKMREGEILTWNSNSKLLLYYANRIIDEEGPEAGEKAIKSVKAFAVHAGRAGLGKEAEKLKTDNNVSKNKVQFESWLRNGSNNSYTENTVRRYIRALEKAGEWLEIRLEKSIFEESLAEFEATQAQIKAADNYKEINQNHGHGDLSAALNLYRQFLEEISDSTQQPKAMETPMTIKEAINIVKAYIEYKGFTYADELIENFYLCLKSKPFVILAGTSGTGKTRLVKLFSQAIGANYKMVAVRPDWSDSTDLFGHVDLNGRFIPGEILDYICAARQDPENAYILCLDEMNLARVEYYLSDFLSVIETRDLVDNEIISDTLISDEKYGPDQLAREKYGEVRFPQNLYIIGTVNMDETTFPFSKKVLDRANTIEFNYVDVALIGIRTEETESLYLNNDFLKSNYLLLNQAIEKNEEYVREICSVLQNINNVLKIANAHIGYRIRDEIVFYMLNNHETGLLDEDKAMDYEILQKVLPRIQGSSTSIKTMLCELFKYLAGDYEGFNTQNSDASSGMMKKLDTDKVRYPKSAEKVAFMVKRFEEDGFTSYWL